MTTSNHAGRKVLYWLSTGMTALAYFVMAAGNLTRQPAMAEAFAGLGYPPFLMTILGAWMLLGALAILFATSRPRLQEWAYAGMFFHLSGATFSHVAHGDPMGHVIVPLVPLALVLTSWALRSARGAAGPAGLPARLVT